MLFDNGGIKMLIRFAVENYRSFKTRQVFSMAAGKYTRHKSHLIVINGKRLLKGAVLYGANAAGKSNLIKAINFGKNIALRGTKNTITINRHFRIDPSAINDPGVFQYDIVSNGHFYSYGFAISYTKNTFCSEWLYLCDDGKEICIFDRNESEPIHTEIKFSKTENKQRFKIYAEDVSDDKSFLTEIARHKLFDVEEFAPFFDVLKWFLNLITIFPQTKYNNYNQLLSSDTHSSVEKLLKYFDTGIESVSGVKKSMDEILAYLPDEVKFDITHSIQESLAELEDEEDDIQVSINGKRFSFKKENNEIVATQLMMNHGNPADLFNLEDESDGTKRLFDLIPLFQKGKEEKVILIDELDRSFHSKLTAEFVQKFFEVTEGYSSQLIVTLHDAYVMDLNMLRQDEIWFIERNTDHSSELYSLNKFKERFDHAVAKDYLLGRYGSIPCFAGEFWDEEEDD